MNTARPYFQIDQLLEPFVVTGRNCGSDIAIGQRFNICRCTRFFRVFNRCESEKVAPDLPVELRIERIESYGNDLRVLTSGMTALLELSGDGRIEIENLLRHTQTC